jgi:hypothetical protein
VGVAALLGLGAIAVMVFGGGLSDQPMGDISVRGAPSSVLQPGSPSELALESVSFADVDLCAAASTVEDASEVQEDAAGDSCSFTTTEAEVRIAIVDLADLDTEQPPAAAGDSADPPERIAMSEPDVAVIASAEASFIWSEGTGTLTVLGTDDALVIEVVSDARSRTENLELASTLATELIEAGRG